MPLSSTRTSRLGAAHIEHAAWIRLRVPENWGGLVGPWMVAYGCFKIVQGSSEYTRFLKAETEGEENWWCPKKSYGDLWGLSNL